MDLPVQPVTIPVFLCTGLTAVLLLAPEIYDDNKQKQFSKSKGVREAGRVQYTAAQCVWESLVPSAIFRSHSPPTVFITFLIW